MLTINVSELILTVINFFLLLFLMKRFLYTPLTVFMEARKAQIEERLEQESTAKEALLERKALREAKRKESREEARRFLQESRARDELRYGELMAQAQAKNVFDRKTVRDAEDQRNQKEQQLLAEETNRLAALLADGLLDRFPDMPQLVIGNALRLAVEKAENTWEHGSSEWHQGPETTEKTQKTSELFTPCAIVKEGSEQRSLQKEHQQLDEKWEQLAALLAERLLCPSA